MPPNQDSVQRQIQFANSPDAVSASLDILREVCRHERLVGDNEFQTVRNAVAMDTMEQAIIRYLNRIDFIKQGGLLTVEK